MTLFFESYTVQDSGIALRFEERFPDGHSDYQSIFLTQPELDVVSTQAQLRSLVEQKLKRKLNALGIASKLNQFIGQAVTI